MQEGWKVNKITHYQRYLFEINNNYMSLILILVSY